ncbi:MAG: DUF6067 family protein [Bacteroidales bacterium]
MKALILISLLSLASYASSAVLPDEESQYASFAPDGIPFLVADSAWKADMQGNHRAVVHVNGKAAAVVAELPWRRPDLRPETKKIVVVDAKTGENVQKVYVQTLTSEKGVVAFEPVTVPGDYYIYYLPYKYRKGYDDARYGKPWNNYLLPDYKAVDVGWVKEVSANISTYPKAVVKQFESRSRFDTFTQMGIIATEKEMEQIRRSHTENPIIFTEDRAFPIRLTNQLPCRWIKKGPSNSFKGMARPNEYYVWQIGLWAANGELKNVRLQFNDFVHSSGNIRIPKEAVTCFNQEGINWDGKPISFDVNVPKEKIQALWCGIQIPENTRTGVYKSTVTVNADGITPRKVAVEINVKGDILADKGDGDLWRHARLRWLNSTIGTDSLPTSLYQPMAVEGNRITATGKQVTIAPNGLVEALDINGHAVLPAPLKFVVQTNKGTVTYAAEDVKIIKDADGLVSWNASSTQDGLRFTCKAYMEYDGYIRYNILLSSDQKIEVKDIQLVTTYTPYASEYCMGTGLKGGYRPVQFTWDWKGPWDSYWMGGADAGLHVEFRGGSYHGPLINDYKPEPSPVWSNQGKGKVTILGAKGQMTQVIASTGPCTIDENSKDFEFALLITPVKQVNSAKHFSERYYHGHPEGFDKATEEGPNIVNIHHAEPLNPVINYPFIVRDSLIKYIEHQHQANRKVKLYYTIRELTNYVHEIHALKSLNHEIFSAGVGYGLPWHCEHLIDDYRPAWYSEMPGETSDAALVLSGFSRWINYYLEGLRWMFENYKIDGLYMDDVSFDRTVMKRMRKIMNQYHPGALIDLHSNTGYSVGPANQYTDFFPYVDRLWFGESFRYNEMTPDEWLVTFSGVPFGQMGEMLQDGGNRFLGMVYGATTRHSYIKSRPAPIWALWKSFGIEQARMVGYWEEDCPVKTHSDLVKATAFVKEDKVLISIGNFDVKNQTVQLDIDWKALGMSPDRAKITAPAVTEFQEETHFKPGDLIQVKAKEGWLLIVTAQ